MRVARCPTIALCLVAFPSIAGAWCFDEAAARYKVSAQLLRDIAIVESSMRPDVVGVNDNGSEDIGMMQISSSWLPKLRRYGISRDDLFDPCVNVHVGAWILAHNIAQFGLTWRAVGAYNARSEPKREIYVKKVWAVMQKRSGA